LCPANASVHFSRADVPLDRPLAAQFDAMIEEAPHVGRVLAKADVAAIVFACTSASFHRGFGSDLAIGRAIGKAAGVVALTTATAVVLALEAVGAKRVAVATPYVDWVVEAERRFLEHSGFFVTNITGLGLARGSDINSVPREAVVENSVAADTPDSQAVLVSCTDYAAARSVPELERR